MDDSLALRFMYLPDDCMQDKRGCLFEFFIFLLQFHALGAADNLGHGFRS